MKRIALLFSSVLFNTVLFAQEDTLELHPVEVQSTRAGANAPFTKTNIKRADITKQNLGQDLPFLLNQTPSVVINADAGNGVGYTGIRIRGTDATRINVTLNGIPFNDPESQGAFFVNLPDFASSVSSIQIQRGVGTSSIGTGAFGGTINMSTNEVSPSPYVEINNSYGSFNTIKNTVRAGTGLLGNRFTTDVRLSRIGSDGYIDRARTDLQSLFLSSAYLANNTSLRLNVILGKEKTYQAWNGVSESDLKTNRTINYAGMEKQGEPYNNETDNYWQNHYQLFFNHKFSDKLTFNNGVFYVRGKGYYEQYKADETYADYGLSNRVAGTITESDLVRQLWLDNHYYGDVFSLLYRNNTTELTFGGVVSKYLGDHIGEVIWAANGMNTPTHRWYLHDAVKNDVSVYGKWQQNITPTLQFFTDLQFRRVVYNIDGFRDNPTLEVNNKYNFFNPKAGLSYRNNNWFAYGSYSVGNKEPNRDDFEAGASQQPKREQLHDIELGVERRNTNFSAGATFYYMRYNDQLVLTGKINDVGAYTRTNIDDSYRLGIELQSSAKLTNWLQLSGNLTLSRNKILNFTEYLDDYDNGGQKANVYKETDISFSPDITGAATVVILPLKNLELNFLSKYVGKQYLDNTQNEQRKLNAFFTQDVRAIYTFQKSWLKNVNIIAQVNNVFNKLYEPNGYTYSYLYNNELVTENFYFPMAGRNWMVGLNVRL